MGEPNGSLGKELEGGDKDLCRSKKANDACVHDPFLTPFTDGFSRYHQIKVVPKNRSKTTFMMKWGCF